jgi:hypothetical protein
MVVILEKSSSFVVRQNNKNLKLERERGIALKKYSPGLNPEKAPRW